MDSLEDLFQYEKALVFGIGGSGDIFGSIPTARLLQQFDIDVTLGGMAWEPVPYDTKPGPRSIDEVQNIERINDTMCLVSEYTQTADGLVFTESIVANQYEEEIVLIGMDDGIQGMIEDIENACNKLDIDVIVGIDVGGDAIAHGNESGLRSPVTDAYGVASLAEIGIPTCLGVFGYTSDGELTIDEMEKSMARIASMDGLLGSWGLTQDTRDEIETLLEHVDTEASQLPIEAAKGDTGTRYIRGGEVKVDVKMPSTVTFYFEPSVIKEQSQLPSIVEDTESIDRAVEMLKEAGFPIEFDTERQRLDNQNRND